VTAISPALIAGLVGSLVFFLAEILYSGRYEGRLLWTLFFFVVGIVLVARISIEVDHTRAAFYGLFLATVSWIALMAFVDYPAESAASKYAGGINFILMGVVWWCAHKLTWDCTLIDDSQDASGQGLLQQMGLDPSAAPPDRSPPGTTSRAVEPEATTSAGAASSPPWWETLLEPDRRPHAPGVWVVYFSLAALPLFGIGGWFVPASDPVARAWAFGLLVITDDRALKTALRDRGARTARTSWLIARLERPALSAPSIGNRKPPATPHGSGTDAEDPARVAWKPGRGATKKRGNPRRGRPSSGRMPA